MLKINLGIGSRYVVAAICFLFGNSMANESENLSSARIFLAGEAAYHDFSKSVKRQVVRTSDLSIFLANIENYEIVLHEDPDSYVVKFTPRRYMGQTLRGGGAEYKIDKKNFLVIGVVRYK